MIAHRENDFSDVRATNVWRVQFLVNEAERLELHARKLLEQAAGYREQARSLKLLCDFALGQSPNRTTRSES